MIPRLIAVVEVKGRYCIFQIIALSAGIGSVSNGLKF
jgi:hypothetical protein